MDVYTREKPLNGSDTVIKVIADFVGVDSTCLSQSTSLCHDLGLDSIDMLALAVALELRFDVCIADEELGRVQTVGGVVPCVMTAIALRCDRELQTLNSRN
jgi:acyl carrier protein